MVLQCPLEQRSDSLGMCKKEKCAWWLKGKDGKEGCSIKILAQSSGEYTTTSKQTS